MPNIEEFFQRQFALWPEVAARFDALKNVVTKEVGGYRVQFNPARAVSTAAKVDAASIAARPCFLCSANRPKEQISIPLPDQNLEILVNPFPIFPGHLTIADTRHRPQSLAGQIGQMRYLSSLLPGYTVFYNGPRCGASAPDHMHYQAVPSRFLRIPRRFYSYTLPATDERPVEEVDPMVNLLCTDGVVTVIPRRKHRPDCYGDLLVSPAAIDLAGTLIAVRREDFDRLDADLVNSIIREVTFREPLIYVELCAGTPKITPNPDGTTTIDNIVIGKDFHWEDRLSMRYEGEIIDYDGKLINRIGLEEYLCSVISSEMSSSSSPELLKAHAVISRSWALSRMRAYRDVDPEVPSEASAEEICVWFDHNDHAGYDVCSDDHCQRYQGIGRINGAVRDAVDATRGLVLVSNGKICDTRFSKCCGGAFERFENCWQPVPHVYLREGCDILPPQPLPDLTVEANAREWILSRPASFCGDVAPEILAQVLNDFDRDATPDFFRWTVSYSSTELSDLIRRRSGIDYGKIIDLIPLSRGSSGRIYRLKIVGEKRSDIIGKELLIRRWLSESHLYSSAFVVDRDGSDFILRGAGWGHGVGLCQIGAARMAAEGYSFSEILAHYFPSARLINLSDI